MSDDDRELRKLFARLKDEDRGRTPSFRAPAMTGAPRRRPMARVVLAAAIVGIAVVLARPDQTPRITVRPAVDLGTTAWRSPTDFLLNTPGSELLRSVPSVGSPDDWPPMNPRGSAPVAESTRRTPS
jgi:hypothetical protein